MEDDSPLELFKQGIRSKETLDKYTRTLQQITCKILEDVLEGTFEERVQLVDMGRKDPKWMRDMLVKLSGKLRERTELPKDHGDYLNPDSIGNYFKPIKKLLDMNDVVISWKKIYATYPERDNVPESRGWTRDEIAKMLRHAHGPMERALVLVLASSGMRAGPAGALVITSVFWPFASRPGRPPVDGAGPAPRRAGHIPERPVPPFRYGCLQPFPRTCRDPRPYVSSSPDSRAPGRHPPPLWCRLWHGGPGERDDLCFLARHAAFHSPWRVPCIPPGTAPPADGESAKRKSAVAWPLQERSAGGCPAAPGPSRRCRRGDGSIRSPRTERRPTAESHKATSPHLPWHRSRSSP